MICRNCLQFGEKLVEVLDKHERIFILTSAASMLQHQIGSAATTALDKQVASSVITKTLLSFEPASRNVLIEQLKRSAGIAFSLDSCPHQKLEVV